MDAVERLAGNTQDVPVVVLTGLAEEEKVIEALRHGAQDHLFKSHMNGEWLRSSMRHAAERHRLLGELAALQEQIVEGARIRALAKTAGAAAHEINNPLAVILDNMELLVGRNDLSSHDRQMLNIIHDASVRTERIVRDMDRLDATPRKSTSRIRRSSTSRPYRMLTAINDQGCHRHVPIS